MFSEENHVNGQFEKIEYTSESSEPSSCDLTELVYKLDWVLRDAIISNLNSYTQLLFGKQLATAEKERLAQANTDLHQQLVNLPLKSDNGISDLRSSEVVLELAFGVRGEILNALITNQSLIKADLKESEGTRMKMIKTNNSLISAMMKLPVTVSDNTAEDADGQILKVELNSLTELSGLTDQFVSLDQANKDNRLRLNEQAERISALGAELDKLRGKDESDPSDPSGSNDLSDLVRLTDGEKIIFLKKASAEFECSFDDMAAFLKSGEKRKRQVAIFKNVICSIEISKVTKERDYLSVLVSLDDFDRSLPKEGYCEITLLNQQDCLKKESFTSYFKFTDTDCLVRPSMCCGEKHLISMKALRYNHFIEDDQIEFRIYLDMPRNVSERYVKGLIFIIALLFPVIIFALLK